jgi:hypothetical protein
VKKLTDKMESEFNKNGGKFFSGPNYYMSNWAAFGYAMATNNLPNLYNGQGNSQAANSNANNTNSNGQSSSILDAVNTTIENVITPATPKATTSPTPIAPSIFNTQPTTPPQSNNNQGQGQLNITYPSDGQSVNGKFTFKVNNTTSNMQGTWWSVDSGSWVSLYKPDSNSNEWLGDIDVSSWNWGSNNEYILHAWTKDKDNNQYHTQIKIKKQ